MPKPNKSKIEEVLNRGVEHIYPSGDALSKALKSGKKLRIYNGIDPTGKLHVGHGVVLQKLRQLQDLGHEVIVLFGGFTGTIGDPTDKLATRQALTPTQAKKNMAGYKKLITKVLHPTKTKFKDNAVWSNKLKPGDMLGLTSHFTVSRLLERDMFQERIKQGKEIHLNEFMYPVFQAYDAVAMDVDMQIGGNDQTFNMLAGRTLMKKLKNKEKFVLSTKLLVDATGKKMSTTGPTKVNLDDAPVEMYGKIMSWTDGMIVPGFELATAVPLPEVIQIKNDLKAGKNPKPLKMLLAYKLVEQWHDTKAAIAAEEKFKDMFEKKGIPKDIKNVKLAGKSLIDVLVKAKLVESKSEARRMLKQKAVKVDGGYVVDEKLKVKKGSVVQKGKRFFVKVV